MVYNNWCKPVRVDVKHFKVFIPMEDENGVEKETELVALPAKTLPLTRRYFFF